MACCWLNSGYPPEVQCPLNVCSMMMSTIWNIFLLTSAILLMAFNSGDIHLDLFLSYAEEDVVFIAFLVLSQELPAPAGGLQVQGAEQVVAALPQDPALTPDRRTCYPACGGGAGFCHGRCVFFGLRCVQGSCSRSPYF